MTGLMDSMTSQCPYINVHEACSVSTPISELRPDNRYRHCHHIEGKYCQDYSKYTFRLRCEARAFQQAVET